MADLDVLEYFKLVGHIGGITRDTADPGTKPDFITPDCAATISLEIVGGSTNLVLKNHAPPLLLGLIPIPCIFQNGVLRLARDPADQSEIDSDPNTPGNQPDPDGVWLLCQTDALELPVGATMVYNFAFQPFDLGGTTWKYDDFSFVASQTPGEVLDVATLDRINEPPSGGNTLVLRRIPDHYIVDPDAATLTLIDASGNPMGPAFAYGATGVGDMLMAIYDPNGRAADVYARNNHTGTQPASTIIDFAASADARILLKMITDITANNNDTTIPTSAAVKTLVDTLIAGIVAGTSPNHIQPVGDGTSTDITVIHNLGTEYVGLVVFTNSTPKQRILVPYEVLDANTLVINNEEVWDPAAYIAAVTVLGQSDTTAPNPGTLNFSSSTSSSLTYTFTGASDPSGIGHIDAYDATTNTLLAANVTSPWTRAGLLASTSYATVMKVYDNEGNPANTNTVTHSTDAPAGDTIAPTPGVLTFVSKDTASITYTFTAGSDNVAVTHVDAYDAATNTLLQANATSPYTRTGLSPSTPYGTFMRYADAAGNHADSNTDTHTTDAPPSSGISFIAGHAEKTTTSLGTMPAHQAGDTLVIIAYRDGFNTPPSLAAGWTDRGSDGLNNNSIRVGTKVATSSGEVSGTWTNCTDLICLVYRGAVSVGAVAFANGVGAAITIPALTLQVTDGTSWVVAGGGDRQGGFTLTPASGLTTRAGFTGTSSQQDAQSYDTNAGVTAFAGSSVTATGLTIGWETFAMELKTT